MFFLLRFEWEARILGQFQDPGISTFYERGTAIDDQGVERQYFAMELVDGSTLSEFVAATRPGTREIVGLIRKAAQAVGRAHRRGIIHRDLKPGNILVDRSGNPRVLDFGVARFTEGRPAALRTISGQIVGTVAYMAPEQARGDSDRADTACDVYALGTILFQLLTGTHPLPFEGKPLLEMLKSIELDTPARLGEHNRQLRGDLEIIVEKALRKEPAARYATATELADDLGRWLDHQPITARRPSLSYQLLKFAQRNRLIASAAALVLCVAIVSGVLLIRAWRDERAARKDSHDRRREAIAAERIAVTAQDAAIESKHLAVIARNAAESARQAELEQSMTVFQ